MSKRSKTLLIITLLVALLFSGCAQKERSVLVPGTEAFQFTDSLGRIVTLQKRPERVVCLTASYAETWMLAGGEVLATTSDALERTELALPDNVQVVGTVKDPSYETIIALDADFVLLSADIPSHLSLGPVLDACGIAHAFFHVEQIEDYLAMLDICTELTGKEELYYQHGLKVQESINAILASQRPAEDRPTYLLLRSYATNVKAKGGDMMTARMLGDLSLTNICDLYPSLLEDLGMETILNENPTYIFVIPMGSEERALATMTDLLQTNAAFGELDAVRQGRYHLLPKSLFHYKPNARWEESYAYLANLLSN